MIYHDIGYQILILSILLEKGRMTYSQMYEDVTARLYFSILFSEEIEYLTQIGAIKEEKEPFVLDGHEGFQYYLSITFHGLWQLHQLLLKYPHL